MLHHRDLKVLLVTHLRVHKRLKELRVLQILVQKVLRVTLIKVHKDLVVTKVRWVTMVQKV